MGMIFYAVPHSGKQIAQYVENYNKAFPHRLVGILKKLKEFETEMQTLSEEFVDSLKKAPKNKNHNDVIQIYSFAEQLPYNKVLVVPWNSVSELTGHIMTLQANHVDICKPSSKGDPGYQKLLEILELFLVPDSTSQRHSPIMHIVKIFRMVYADAIQQVHSR
ncbi:unnamed protein product [Sphagnum jensenii]|jgi:hypothetical protein|uniref:Uncharacterized protein n=1 Tax=Sphagnum jensenii TaxID=128206 RepID=A0ABP0W9I9_9BRYO